VAISVRSVTVGTNDGSSTSVSATTPASTQTGDLLVIAHSNDFYTLGAMPTPTCTGSPTLTAITNGTADGGTGEGHIKTYTAVANTGGANTVTVTETGTADEEKAMTVYVLTGADTATPVDAAANSAPAGTSDVQDNPGVTCSTSNAFLMCFNNSGPAANSAYGSPASPFVEQYEIHIGGMSGVGGTEQLSASGATGVRTFTCVPGNNIRWVAVTVAIRTASGGAAFTATPTLVVPKLATLQRAVW
jgi:hypothetical protein